MKGLIVNDGERSYDHYDVYPSLPTLDTAIVPPLLDGGTEYGVYSAD